MGPGAYRDVNKWNKRTYNLKFLSSNQTSAPTSPKLPMNPTTTEVMGSTPGSPSSRHLQIN